MKSMMKRLLFFMILICILMSAVYGCSSNKQDAVSESSVSEEKAKNIEKEESENKTEELQKAELKFWGYQYWKGITGQEEGADFGDYEKHMADKFSEANPNVSITYELLPS